MSWFQSSFRRDHSTASPCRSPFKRAGRRARRRAVLVGQSRRRCTCTTGSRACLPSGVLVVTALPSVGRRDVWRPRSACRACDGHRHETRGGRRRPCMRPRASTFRSGMRWLCLHGWIRRFPPPTTRSRRGGSATAAGAIRADARHSGLDRDLERLLMNCSGAAATGPIRSGSRRVRATRACGPSSIRSIAARRSESRASSTIIGDDVGHVVHVVVVQQDPPGEAWTIDLWRGPERPRIALGSVDDGRWGREVWTWRQSCRGRIAGTRQSYSARRCVAGASSSPRRSCRTARRPRGAYAQAASAGLKTRPDGPQQSAPEERRPRGTPACRPSSSPITVKRFQKIRAASVVASDPLDAAVGDEEPPRPAT